MDKKKELLKKKFVKAKFGKTLPYKTVRLLSIKGKEAHISWMNQGSLVDAHINICHLKPIKRGKR